MKKKLTNVVLLAMSLLSGTMYAQAPANDLCTGAINLPLTNMCVNGSNTNATNDATATTASSQYKKGVWYTFVATANSTIITLVPSDTLDPFMVVTDGCNSTSRIARDVGNAGDDEMVAITTTPGQTYYVCAGGYGSTSNDGAFCIKATSFASPANDVCANAINVPTTATCVNGTTEGNSVDFVGRKSINGFTNGSWYKITATSTSTSIIVDPADTLNVVFTVLNNCADTIGFSNASAGSTGANEALVVNTVVGQVYYVLVGAAGSDITGSGASSPSGDGAFCIKAEPFVPAVNDACANAINLTINAACTNGTTVNSTPDANSPASCGGTGKSAVWYKFTATGGSTTVRATTTDSLFDGVLSIHTRCDTASIQCGDDGLDGDEEFVTFTTIAGKVYYAKIADYAGTGSFCMAVTNSVAGLNDALPNLLIYPNPATTSLQLDGIADEKGMYVISDISGKIVLQGNLASSINIEPIAKGMYVLQLQTNQGITTKSFIKQ